MSSIDYEPVGHIAIFAWKFLSIAVIIEHWNETIKLLFKCNYLNTYTHCTKIKFSFKDIFSKCDQIRCFYRTS